MSLCFALMLLGEFYFIDGLEFLLVDGTIIKTAAEVQEDRFTYSWEEEGMRVNLSKTRVRSVTPFSLKVSGRAKSLAYKNRVQRRISGRPIHYQREGRTFLKCRHVNEKGMSNEGGAAPNQVAEVEWLDAGGAAENEAIAYFVKSTAGSTVSFSFYDLRGVKLYETSVRVEGARKPRKKKKALQPVRFTVPVELEPSLFGLLEVATIASE